VHAPETQCIAKGKLRKPYEFGHKVGLVTTAKGQFVVGAVAFSQRPFDGHTLAASVQQVKKMMGQVIRREIYVDKGHRATKPRPSAHSQDQTQAGPDLRRWYRKRNGIEAAISHMKNDGWLGRNYLKGMIGSRINALLSACGQNLRKLLAWLAAHPGRPFCALLLLLLKPLNRRSFPLPASA